MTQTQASEYYINNLQNNPMIEIKDLKKIYPGQGKNIVALDGINLTIQSGEIYGIIGMSGAGKSTLVRCINMLEKPTGVSVSIDGQDVGSLRGKELLELRRSVSLIFQQFNLLIQRTAIKNVQFPLEIASWPRQKARQRALEMMKHVGLEDKCDAYPSQLSGGQKQRVGIARAARHTPKGSAERRGDVGARPSDHAVDSRAAASDQPQHGDHDCGHHASDERHPRDLLSRRGD